MPSWMNFNVYVLNAFISAKEICSKAKIILPSAELAITWMLSPYDERLLIQSKLR
jgi:hypothetical protein